MENTNKKSASQRILEKLENLMGEDSNVLVLLEDQKLSAVNIKDANIDKINRKNNKINEIKELVNKLHSEASKIENLFTNYKTDDFKTLIDVFGLNIHFDEDSLTLSKKLPEFVNEKEEEVSNLTSDINNLEEEVNSLTSKITELESEISKAKTAQKALIDLITESVNQTLNKTREEVISVLNMVSFDEKEAMQAAKLILFPEDELIPYFKKNNVLDELQKSIDKITYDLADEEKGGEKPSEEKPIFEDKKEELKVEDVEPAANTLEPKKDSTTTSISEDEIHAPIQLSELNLNDSLVNKEIFEKELDTPISINELKESFLNLDDITKEEPTISEDINLDLVSDEVKETPEVKEEIDVDKYLKMLDKDSADAKLIDNLFIGISEARLESFIKEIKDLDISIKSVPLLTYKHDLDNYIKNIKTLKDNGYPISDMDIEKFSPSLYLISNDQMIANLVILKKYNINLLKANGKLCFKLLSLDTSKLIDNLNLLIEMGDIEIVRNNIEVLVKDVKNICERILFCKTNSIPYIEEKGHKFIFRSFIYEEKLLENLLESKIDLNNIKNTSDVNNYIRSITNSHLVDILDYSKEYNPALDNEKLEKEYNKVIKRLEDKVNIEDEYYTLDNLVFSKNNTIRNIINILNKNDNNVEIKDILIVALLYNSHKDIDSCEKVINAFNN